MACRMCGSDRLASLGEVRGYAFVECRACAFAFAPAVTPATLARAYGSGWHGADDGAPEGGWTGLEPGFLDPAFQRLPRAPLRILDFGAGRSPKPDELRAEGHRVVAVDVAPPETPHPDRLTGDLLALPLPEAWFDLAYAFQVFEHLPEPRPALERLLRLVRPGGLVLVHTDMETPERAEGFDRWWYVLPPDHCAFYRPRTFEAFAQDHGCDVAFADAKRVVLRRAR